MPKVQSNPIVDSAQIDPFESLVEMYYQTKGYITSSNKWFWFFEEGKKQRGYQDIDVLAIDENETLIITVTTNLDDKINNINKLHEFFKRVREYLKNVQQYSWLMKDRKIRYVIAFAYGDRMARNISQELKEESIELLSSNEIIRNLRDYISNLKKSGLRTNNQLARIIELWLKAEKEIITP